MWGVRCSSGTKVLPPRLNINNLQNSVNRWSQGTTLSPHLAQLRNASSKPSGEPLTITSSVADTYQITIPLTNNERCKFSLKGEKTIASFLSDLKTEDHNIQSVNLYSSDGSRIAQSTSIQEILNNLSDFKLKINNKEYIVTPQLHRAGKVGISENELNTLKKEFLPLYLQKKELDAKANSYTNLVVYGGLGYLVAQWAFLARLTWWEFNWDVMEPVTYFVTFGTAVLGYIYFVATKREYSYENFREGITISRMRKLYEKNGFDVDKYFFLQHKLNQIDQEIIPDIDEQIEGSQNQQKDQPVETTTATTTAAK